MHRKTGVAVWGLVLAGALAALPETAAGVDAGEVLKAAGRKGLVVILGDSECKLARQVARAGELLIYVQLRPGDDLAAARKAADAAGLLGKQIYVEHAATGRIGLADNLADAVVVLDGAGIDEAEVMRVLRPGGAAIRDARGSREAAPAVKPAPDGIDEWTHPYHGPDNNPQSLDRLATWPYLTQFLGEPWYGAMPQVTVAAGGRIFKLFGHFTSKRREWPMLHKMVVINAYNGTVLWQRDLKKGFMIHRNTIVATADTLYLADDASCKLIDPATGRDKGEISPPADAAGGKCWKWMALSGGVLYAMIGGPEYLNEDIRGAHHGRGWGWSAMGEGYGGKDPDPAKYPWGFGHHVLALEAASGKVLWTHREDEPIDARAVVMRDGHIYYYCHEKYLVALDASDGKPAWRNSDERLLTAIGPHFKAQFATTGFSSTAYLKAGPKALYFAGPQRTKLVAASTEDGRLLWWKPDGNRQLVLRDEGLFAMGFGKARSQRYDPLTGKLLKEYNVSRVSCTRATGSPDSVFVRGQATYRFDVAADQPRLVTPMRPPCCDGVMIAHGLLYWGPWMCDCNLSLVGNIAVAPAGDFKYDAPAVEDERLWTAPPPTLSAEPGLPVSDNDWPTYRKDNLRSAGTAAKVAATVRQRWRFAPPAARGCTAEEPQVPTAPVAAGGMVFVGYSDGAVRALDGRTGRQVWAFHTGGAVTFPPTISGARAYVGSADGWVYCLAAPTGKLLWRFRAAPIERKIPVYGRLSSTWPVASGVLVEDGVAYAAAGIANYDGTHVYARDAITGRIKWQNNTSGYTNPATQGGVSVQGCLLLHDGKLYLAGGNHVSPGIYDARTGKCLNPPQHLWAAGGWGNLLHRGRDLYLIADRVQASGQKLYSPAIDLNRPFPSAEWVMQASAGDVLIARKGGRLGRTFRRLPPGTDPTKLDEARPAWDKPVFKKVLGLAVAGETVVFIGHDLDHEDNIAAGSIVALRAADGSLIWRHQVPGPMVPWGLAIDASGQVIVTLRDGSVECLGS